MNKHAKFYEDMKVELVPKDIRVSKKQLEYYISNVSRDYPKRFTVTELKYFILGIINYQMEQDRTIGELRQEILEYESMYDMYDYVDDDCGGDVYLSDGVYLTPDGGSYDDREED
jgi:hypothetical protein